jgi:hypothetical protein
VKRRDVLAQAVEQVVQRTPGTFRGDAHQFLRMVYSDPSIPLDVRLDAAKSAIRFETPALSASAVTVDTSPQERMLAKMTDVQLLGLLRQIDQEEARTIDAEAVLDEADVEDDEPAPA